MKRPLLSAMLGLVALVVLALGAGFLWLRTSLPETSGTVTVEGPAAPVEIVRDANGVPHIFAGNAIDAYFALGFVHAQDRLWQMEFMRRLGAGRLSEVLGESSLSADRFTRTMGFYRLAEQAVETLPPEMKAGLDAYAGGVNAYLANHSGALPPEFVLLRHTPEPWRPADSMVWGKLMGFRLSIAWRRELLRGRLADLLTPERAAELFPGDPQGAPITLGQAAPERIPWAGLARVVPPELISDSASNAWVVGGARTATGKPILANDPHLGFGAPIVWYLARLEAPGLSLTGATAPGVPLMVLGHNGRVAWGMVTAGGDTDDLYIESIAPGDGQRYLTPEGPRPFKTRKETIRVKDGETETLTVRETRHGPVISEVVSVAKGPAPKDWVIALASTVLRPDDRTAEALYRINRATDWTSFAAATEKFGAPLQNLFYADRAGNIGFVMPGRVPMHRTGDGTVPVEGYTGRHEWTGFIPFAELPRSLNPAAGFIANANNRVTGDAYPHSITRYWEAPYRAERLVEVLRKATGHRVEDSAGLQMDILSAAARRVVPLMLSVDPRDKPGRRAVELLEKWDFRMRRDRPEPLIYSAWLHHLMAALVADELGDAFAAYDRPRPRFVASVLADRQHWCDDIHTPQEETCQDRLHLALDKALDDLIGRFGEDIGDWRWGDAHRALFPHRVLTHVPVGKWIADLSIETDGGDHTLNRGQARRGGSFRHTHGAGFRAIYDLADPANSRYLLATGQSGNPLSPHYKDFLQRWRDGRYIAISGGREALREASNDVLTLEPGTPK